MSSATRPLFADERLAARLLSMRIEELRAAEQHLPAKVEVIPGVNRWRVADLEKLGNPDAAQDMDGINWG